MGLIGFKEGDTLLSLRHKLEGIRIFESALQFWDSRLGSPVHTKLEALIFVEDLEGKVVLFETKNSEESNLVLVGQRVKTEPPVIGTQLVERNVIYKEQNEGIVDVSIGSSQPSLTGDDRLEGKALFLLKRMSHAVETAWREQVKRLIIWQQKENKVDHEWCVRTWDKGECVVGVFEYLKCRCFLGRPDRGEEKAAVQNVFINYRNKHIGCEKHVANWRRPRNLPLNVGEKKTPKPEVNHRVEIDAACPIVEKVNGEELSQKKPFVVEGDVKREPCYSWIFKVRCVYCGSKFELVPSKRNLEHNLREHLSSEKHRENVEFQLCLTSHGPVRSGAKGQLKKFGRDLKRDKFPGMALPLHLLGSDSCEQFFSRVGGMRGYERNYDFGDLLDCASGFNRLAVLEYGEDVIKLSKAHVKHRPLWAKLHPLPPSHAKADLSDFARLTTDDQITEALKVGLQEAQTLLTQLNMSPHVGVRIKLDGGHHGPWRKKQEYLGRPPLQKDQITSVLR
ncbi:hypothetical protein R1flu_025967 [Riccia fluitans]|uniref:Uncharacterized protein n=1 Tax=Riccia fluitans TaxID=41844 RepID=A0ABD1XF62_9MARC